MEILAKFRGVTFSMTGDNGAEFFERVESFDYLGRVLHQADDDWPVVLRNIRRASKFGGVYGSC